MKMSESQVIALILFKKKSLQLYIIYEINDFTIDNTAIYWVLKVIQENKIITTKKGLNTKS